MEANTAGYLVGLLRSITRELAVSGFSVISISCDGAAENRSVWKHLCDVAASQLVSESLLRTAAERVVLAARVARKRAAGDDDDDEWQAAMEDMEDMEQIEALVKAMAETMVGWRLKCGAEDRIIIFVPDTPHIIKKVANSLERRDAMELDGQPVKMQMLYDVFRATHFDATTGKYVVGMSALTEAHFYKNSLLRTNVRLATQVLSNTMYELCTTVLAKVCPVLHARLASVMPPTLWLVQTMNRLFDIMNSRLDKRNVHLINTPDHENVLELLTASAGVLRWKQQAVAREGVSRPARWLAHGAGNDSVALGLAVAAIAQMYACKTMRVVLKRLDQDVCENHFANVRQMGSKEGVDVNTTLRAEMMSSAVRMTKGAKTNSAGAPKDEKAEHVFDLRTYKPSPADINRESLTVWY